MNEVQAFLYGESTPHNLASLGALKPQIPTHSLSLSHTHTLALSLSILTFMSEQVADTFDISSQDLALPSGPFSFAEQQSDAQAIKEDL